MRDAQSDAPEANPAHGAPFDADLARLIAAWPALSETTKAAIVRLVAADDTPSE